jgi:hypothetical protein
MMEVDLQIPLLIALAFIVFALLRLSYTPGLETSRSDTRGLELLKDWLSQRSPSLMSSVGISMLSVALVEPSSESITARR